MSCSFRLSRSYTRATKALMPLIDAASDDLRDSRTIAHKLNAFCEHRSVDKLRRDLKTLKRKYKVEFPTAYA